MRPASVLSEILKAALRIEKKLDEVLVALKKANPAHVMTPFHFKTQACPLCQKPVEYIPVIRSEETGHEMIRVCGCNPQPTKLPHREEEKSS